MMQSTLLTVGVDIVLKEDQPRPPRQDLHRLPDNVQLHGPARCEVPEANGPIAKRLQCDCRDTLPWLISLSLDDARHLQMASELCGYPAPLHCRVMLWAT